MDAPTLEELRAMPDEELIGAHDRMAEHVTMDVRYALDELHRREVERHSRGILGLTVAIAAMTLVITLATMVNVGWIPL